MTSVVIREASTDDAASVLAVYAPFVESSTITFELEVPSVGDMAGRIAKALGGWCWLVAEAPGGIAGYAYGTRWRDRPAYSRTVETSAYLAAPWHGRGLARALYRELLSRLERKGFHTAVAGVTLPNDASVGLHRALGFEPVGVFREVGWKLGAWHDVAWFQRSLAPTAG